MECYKFSHHLEGEGDSFLTVDVLYSVTGNHHFATESTPEEFPEIRLEYVYHENTTEQMKLTSEQEDELYSAAYFDYDMRRFSWEEMLLKNP